MGNNGRLASLDLPGRHEFPAMQAGEDISAGDLVGVRAGTDSIRRWFKAFGGVTGGGNTQLAAVAIAEKDLKQYQWDGYWRVGRLNGFVNSSGELSGLLAGELVYLSVTTPGGIQRSVPSGTGKLKQVVGDAYCTKQYPASTDKADGILVQIDRAVTL